MSGIYESLSQLFGVDVVGSHYDSEGNLVLELEDGTFLSPNHYELDEVEVTASINNTISNLVNDYPDITDYFEIPEPSDFGSISLNQLKLNGPAIVKETMFTRILVVNNKFNIE